MSQNFKIRICSDLDYEEMVADICYDHGTIAMITQEEGPENMMIEIFSPMINDPYSKFSLQDFLTIIQDGKSWLKYMVKLPDEPEK